MTSYSADFMRAVSAYVKRNGEKQLWLALAEERGLNAATFRDRERSGMSYREAALTPNRNTYRAEHSIKAKCVKLGYKSGRPYYKLKAELEEMGVEHSEDDIYEVLKARIANKRRSP